MKLQRLLIALTLVNLGLLAFLLARVGPVEARDVEPVLRGRALEIVDDQGRVRASIKVLPADPKAEKPYPETVIFRLIDPRGRPNVKLGASEQGAGLGLGGKDDPTYVILKAEGTETTLSLTNQDGRQKRIEP